MCIVTSIHDTSEKSLKRHNKMKNLLWSSQGTNTSR
jgi:hypothetical protein